MTDTDILFMSSQAKRITELEQENRELKERFKRGRWISVKHGHWIYNDAILNRIKCSECGFWSDDLQADNFCPSCGADMRGDGTGGADNA